MILILITLLASQDIQVASTETIVIEDHPICQNLNRENVGLALEQGIACVKPGTEFVDLIYRGGFQ